MLAGSRKSSLRDVAYAEIKKMILSGELKPGEPIPESLICEKAGLSRTPVREAPNQLVSEGLVETLPRRGAFVANISIRDIRDVFEFREVLDCMAVRLAFDRMPSDGLDEFESLFESLLSDADDGDAYEMAEIDRAFHGMILEASGNRWLKELAGLLLDKSRLIRTISLRYPGQMKNSWQEHIELIRAVRAGDRTTAESLALKHVTNARDAVLRAIDGEF